MRVPNSTVTSTSLCLDRPVNTPKAADVLNQPHTSTNHRILISKHKWYLFGDGSRVMQKSVRMNWRKCKPSLCLNWRLLFPRSEGPRVGQECVSTCRCRRSPFH